MCGLLRLNPAHRHSLRAVFCRPHASAHPSAFFVFFYACGGHGNRSLQRSAGGGWKRWLRAGRKGETRALRRPHTTCVETPVENSQGSWEGASVTNEYTTCRQATHTLCVAASMWTDWPPRAHQCRDAVLTCIVTGGGWREGREERAIAPNPCTSPRPCL